MLRAVDVAASAPNPGDLADVIALDYDMRRRRRIVLKARGGLTFLVDLESVPVLKAGAAFILNDGRFVLVEAAPEPLMEITCEDRRHLARLAWHIGNRHLAAEIHADAIRIRADHVIEDMAIGLGAHVTTLSAPFDPESGAYQQSHPAHAHDDHDDDHRHHGHDHKHHDH